MKLISISGKAGSGKDTIKDSLVSHLTNKGLRVQPLSFAGPLKDALVLWFGWDRERLDRDFAYKEGGLGNTNPDDIDPVCVQLGMARRELMQKFGTEGMRIGVHPNFWIIMAEHMIRSGRYDGDVFLVSDSRFLNELNWVESHQGITIRVNRIDSKQTLTEKTQHSSELEWLQFDKFRIIIDNIVDRTIPVEESIGRFHKKIETDLLDSVDSWL